METNYVGGGGEEWKNILRRSKTTGYIVMKTVLSKRTVSEHYQVRIYYRSVNRANYHYVHTLNRRYSLLSLPMYCPWKLVCGGCRKKKRVNIMLWLNSRLRDAFSIG
jgi:hypothetical protein